MSWAQGEVAELEDVPTFLKEMERKAGEVNSAEAKWFRTSFAPAFVGGEVGQAKQQELISTVKLQPIQD